MAERLGQSFAAPYEAVGVLLGDEPIGGVIFNGFTGANVDLSVAGEPLAWSRGILRQLGEYAFGQLGVSRVSIITDKPEVVMLAARLGAKPEGKLRDWYGPGRDAAILGILKKDWIYR